MDRETKLGNRFCQCEIPALFQQEQIEQKIAEYLSQLDREECVTDDIYEERLKKCSVCERLAGGLTCMDCGCFVLVRAKKKRLHCPKAGW